MVEKDFIEYVVKTLVAKSDSIKIEVEEADRTNMIIIKADKNDYGKIMGHRGSIINSIGSLLEVVSRNSEKRWAINVPDRKSR